MLDLLNAVVNFGRKHWLTKAHFDLTDTLTMLDAVNPDFEDILMLGWLGLGINIRELERLSNHMSLPSLRIDVLADEIIHALPAVIMFLCAIP